MTQSVLEVAGLMKTFHLGFFRKRVEAVKGIDFAVQEGEIFGLLGPNGAGKTTTMKMVLRLIFPSAGSIRIFGRSNAERAVMTRVGYMPENPYVYQYLRPFEFLDLCGRLMGMSRKDRTDRAEALIERVGLGHAADRPIGRFSKGMMQRVGLAQALLHDPELLILDEPMSGLDPIGRKQIRDILIEQKAKGKTLLITSHILSDIESLCDRVAIMNLGKVTAYGQLRELLKPSDQRIELELDGLTETLRAELAASVLKLTGEGPRGLAVVDDDDAVAKVIAMASEGGARVLDVTRHRESLEDLFVRNALASQTQAKNAAP